MDVCCQEISKRNFDFLNNSQDIWRDINYGHLGEIVEPECDRARIFNI